METMYKIWQAALVLAVLVAGSGIAHAQGAQGAAEARLSQLEEKVERLEKSSSNALEAYWKDGLRLKTADKNFQFKLGGRIMNDWTFFLSEDDDVKALVGDLEDGTEFRRARFYISGTIYDNLAFKAQYDFAGGDADFKDVYVGLKHVPVVGNVRVGHFKEPFGLEEITSSKYITFMERSLTSAFVPSRNTGLMLYNHALDERLTWAAGVFRDTDNYGDNAEDGKYSVTTRITGLPWYEDDGKHLLHVGLAASHRDPDGDDVRYRERPGIHQCARLVDTGHFAADSVDLLGAEFALVYESASLQGEVMRSSVDAVGQEDPDFTAWYVMGSYFLTGEHRSYKRSSGAFSRVKPINDFRDEEGGIGAWEATLRYSHLDLDDAGINVGELGTITAGLNWYLNPNTRVMCNYVVGDLDNVGDTSALLMRFQIDF